MTTDTERLAEILCGEMDCDERCTLAVGEERRERRCSRIATIVVWNMPALLDAATSRPEGVLTEGERASAVANAATATRTRLEGAFGRRGDLQTLARLVDVSPDALTWLYDEIVGDRIRPSPPVTSEAQVEAAIAKAVRTVSELSDRTSPEDDPGMLLVTPDELSKLLWDFAEDIAPTLSAIGQGGDRNG